MPTFLPADEVDLSHLSSAMHQKVHQMLKPFSSVWNGELGTVTVTKHLIDLQEGTRPVHCQPYRTGPKSRENQQSEVDKTLKTGVIEPGCSEWASPVVLSPKSDVSLRFCVDYRRLNALTVKETYPLPGMDECLDSLGEANFLTTLDCNSRYWQIPISEQDRHKTAFTCHAGCYQFCRMPFGLCNAPATFQRTVDILLAGYMWRSCLLYIEDVIVFSSSLEEQLQHVKEVLAFLRKKGLSLKLKKWNFSSKPWTNWDMSLAQVSCAWQPRPRRPSPDSGNHATRHSSGPSWGCETSTDVSCQAWQ